MRDRVRVVLTVLRDPTLTRLQVAYLASNMAEYATWLAILVYAYGLGGAGLAAVFALVQLIPSGIVAPWTAALGDRYRRDRVLFAVYIWQAGGMLATALALYADAPAPITLLVATLAAVSFTGPRPVQAALLPQITHTPADLTAANGVSGLVENVGLFVGPLLAGLLLGRSEPGDVFLFFAVMGAVGAIVVARLPGSHEPPPSPELGLRSILGASVAGSRTIARLPQVRVVVLVMAAATVVVGALDILVVAVAIDLLRASESWVGYLYSAFGLGGIVGALATVTLVGRRRLTPALATSGAALGLPIAAVPMLPTTIGAPILLGVSGAGLSISNVAGRTLLQRGTPGPLLGQVFGVLEMLELFALALGSVATGVLISTIGVGWTLVVTGLFVPVILLYVWTRLAAIDRDAPEPDLEALALIRGIPIFAPLSAPAMEQVLVNLVRLEVAAEQIVVRQGEAGDRFYVLAEGEVEVSIDGRLVNRQVAPSYFGEIALLRDVPRTATVTAVTALRLLALDRGPFLDAVTGHAQSRAQAELVVEERLAADTRPG